MIAERPHYWLSGDPEDATVCVRAARTAHGAEMLPAHFEGWRLTRDLLGDCAPRFAEFDGSRIRTELVPGRPLHKHYRKKMAGEDAGRLPWDSLWAALTRVYESDRPGPPNPKLIPGMAWATWFSIVRLREAKRHTLLGAFRQPFWSIRAGRALLTGKLRGSFTRAPAVVSEIAMSSRHTLTLGDVHMANLVGGPRRIAFVDFSEVGRGAVSLDLAPLWLEWWLAQGLVAGDDGFADGYVEMWRRFVGPESLLIRMTAEWVQRLFPWMLFAFYADHLELARSRAVDATYAALDRLGSVRPRFARADRLRDLVADAG